MLRPNNGRHTIMFSLSNTHSSAVGLQVLCIDTDLTIRADAALAVLCVSTRQVKEEASLNVITRFCISRGSQTKSCWTTCFFNSSC